MSVRGIKCYIINKGLEDMSENEKKVPTVVVKRLPRYYRYQGTFKYDIKLFPSKMHLR